MFRHLTAIAMLTLLPAVAARADQPLLVRTEVFTSRSEGYHTYRIPAVVVTKEGTLLAFCEGRKTGRSDHGDLDLVLRRSTDQGRTWEKMQIVYEEGGDKKITIGNPCPVVDQSTGVIWLPFCRDNNDVLITHSKDEGRTWAKPTVITSAVKEKDWGWYATGPGNAIQLTRGKHKGRLVIPCDHRVKGRSKKWGRAGRSHTFYSDDHGKTWKLGKASDWGMNECAVVELADGSLMLNMRSYRGRGRRGVAISRDGGHSWSASADDPTLIEPVCQASLIRHTWPEGERPGRLIFSNPASGKSRHRLTVRVSNDEGKSWPVGRMLVEGSAAYSSLVALPDGTIGCLLERDNYRRITFARFNLAWLTKQ